MFDVEWPATGGRGGGEDGRLHVQGERAVVLLGRTGREFVKEAEGVGVTECGCFGRGREIGGAVWEGPGMAGVAWKSEEP